MFRKITAALILAAMLLNVFILPTSAAETGKCGTNVTWSYDTGTETLTVSGEGAMYDYERKYLIRYEPKTSAPWGQYSLKKIIIESGVTTIGDNAFCGCDMTSVTLPQSVTAIGRNAFYNCEALVEVNLPDKMSVIGSCAFYGCSSLSSIRLPDGITSIEKDTFRQCWSLHEITIPEGVTVIRENAFFRCSWLGEITIPKSLQTVEQFAFYDCKELRYVCFDGTKEEFEKIIVEEGNSAYINAAHAPSKNGTCGENVYWSCNTADKTLTISGNGNMDDYWPEESDNGYVVNIPWEAFDPVIEKVVIENGVTGIGACSFYHSPHLKSVTVEEGVEYIGYGAFSDCSVLSSLTLPASIKKIHDAAFYGDTALSNISCGGTAADKNNISIGCDNECFIDAFYYAFDNNTPPIREKAGDNILWYYDSKTGTLTLSGTGEIYDHTMVYLKSEDMSVTDAPWGCFHKSVKTVIIGEGITKIGKLSFCGMDSVYTLVLPSTLSYVGMLALNIEKNDENMTSSLFDLDVYYNGTADDWNKIQFEEYNDPVFRSRLWLGVLLTTNGECGVNTYWRYDEKTATLTISGSGAMQDFSIIGMDDEYYYVNIPWSYYLSDIKKIVIEDGVTVVGDVAFLLCENAASIVIPESVIRIGTESFYGCDGISEVSFSGSNIGWEIMEIQEGNEPLLSAKIKFAVEYQPGDINMDSKVNAVDSNLLRQMILGSMEGTKEEKLAADINEDLKINTVDSNLMKQLILGE